MASHDPERVTFGHECADAVRSMRKDTIAMRRYFGKSAEKPKHCRYIEMNLDQIRIDRDGPLVARESLIIPSKLLQHSTPIAPCIDPSCINFQCTVIAFDGLCVPSQGDKDVAAAPICARKLR